MKQKIVTGFRIEVEPPYGIARWTRDPDRIARAYEEWAREFEEFVRDHRSQDPISLSVIREEAEVCSHCGRDWEEDENGPLCCSKAEEEWSAAKAEA